MSNKLRTDRIFKGRNILPFILIVSFLMHFHVTSALAQGQDSINDKFDPKKISLLVQTDKDSVTLRWVPSDGASWQYANEYGYILERVSMDGDGKFDPKAFRSLTSKPLRPWTKDEWNVRVKSVQSSKQNSTWLTAAQNLLYYKTSRKSGQPDDFNDIRDAADEFTNRLGLRFVDHDVSLGKQYVYRVYVANGANGNQNLDTAYQVVDITAHTLSPAPADLEVEVGDGKLRLHWRESAVISYSGYYIDRSDDGGKNYRRLNGIPHITIRPKGALQSSPPESQYTDTTTVNYRLYKYKVRGVTPFAELSNPAETQAMSRDLTPPAAPRSVRAEPVGAHRIRIKWEMKNATADLAGLMIFRSTLSTGGFQSLAQLSKTMKEFTDTLAAKEVLYYYIITASDTAGNSSESLSASALIVDSLPPSPPLGLQGTIDTNGVVRLHWHQSPEYNMLGYRVLWANDPKHEFAQRTPTVWTDTTFIDTVSVKTLTPYIYYRVASVNKRRMHSAPSGIFALKRPDLIAPTQPVFTHVIVSDSAVELHWARSRSEDLATQTIERRKQNEGDPWRMLETVGRENESYVDVKVEQSVTYEYRLISVDSSGLRSLPCASVQGRPYDRGIRETVRNLRCSYDSVSKSALLHWDYTPSRKEDYWFVIYRATSKSGLAQYHAIKNEPTEFRDSDLPMKPPYQYAVRVVTKSGAESTLSNVVTVK
jgi:fibronectin type 3 domain-containing protein